MKLKMKNSYKEFSLEEKSLIKELHSELKINDRDWHKLKNNPDRRATELLMSAIAQISEEGEKDYVISLVNQALKWIKNELKDPGCPSH